MATAKQPSFKPEEHFRNLKGQHYLEVKWRIVWFREEHPEGYITTEMVEHDLANGYAMFKARVGYFTTAGLDVFATGYGSETRKDFGDFAEKAETKAVGRALAGLGYGTAQAIELDEGDRIVDGGVEGRRQTPTTTTRQEAAPSEQPPRLSVVPNQTPDDDLRTAITRGLEKYPQVRGKLTKALEDMTTEELRRFLEGLKKYAAAKTEEANAAAEAAAEATTPNDLLSVLQAARNEVDAWKTKDKSAITQADQKRIQLLLRNLQRLDPRKTDVDVATIKPASLVGALISRVAMADQPAQQTLTAPDTHEPGTPLPRAANDEWIEDIPF